jgi:hypothetical protein
MLGWVRWTPERQTRLEQEDLLGLPVTVLSLPARARGRARPLDRGAGRLARHGVTRVLAPDRFEGWPQLLDRGLRPVDTQALRCALAPGWVLETLKWAGVSPRRAVLALTGARVSPPMEQVARALCPAVRHLILDAPGGAALAARLGREFGLPVLPPRSARPDLTLAFDPAPVLAGARFALSETALPRDCETLPLLSALWGSGLIKTKQVRIYILGLDSTGKSSYNTTDIKK